MVATTNVMMATERQLGFLRALLDRRAVDQPLARTIDLQLSLGMSARQASGFIDALVRLPIRPAPAVVAKSEAGPGDLWPKVQEGRYAVVDPADQVLKFYQVSKPKEGRWAGFTVLASGDRWPVKVHETKRRILDVIAADPRAALERYGQELGTCGACGRTLTDAVSRAIGIGPVCREKLGYGAEDEPPVQEDPPRAPGEPDPSLL